MSITIQHKRGTAAQWISKNPVLAAGEIGFESNTNKAKIGDGATHWIGLPYISTDYTYVHPTGDGNLHVPETSDTNAGKVLTAGVTAGSLSWTTPVNQGVNTLTVTTPMTTTGGFNPTIAVPVATSIHAGLISASDKIKLDALSIVYSRFIDGGDAFSVYTAAQYLSGGGASG